MTSSTFPKRISLAIGWTASEGQLRIGGNGPLEEREFDKEKFKKFLGVKVYYVDASKGRVGPELVEQDEDRYEFSHDEWTWYSTSTGLAAVV